VEYKSRIKDYRSLGKENPKNRNLEIVSLGSKDQIKDLKKERRLSGLYNKNNGKKIKLI